MICFEIFEEIPNFKKFVRFSVPGEKMEKFDSKELGRRAYVITWKNKNNTYHLPEMSLRKQTPWSPFDSLSILFLSRKGFGIFNNNVDNRPFCVLFTDGSMDGVME